MHQYLTNKLPPSFNNMFTLIRNTEERNNRDSFYKFTVNIPIKKCLATFPRVTYITIWNNVPSSIQCNLSHKVFKSEYKKDIINKYGHFLVCENLSCEECENVNLF